MWRMPSSGASSQSPNDIIEKHLRGGEGACAAPAAISWQVFIRCFPDETCWFLAADYGRGELGG